MKPRRRAVVQSILVSREHPDVQERGLAGARAVAERHRAHTTRKVDETDRYYRFRQRPPSSVTSCRTATITPHVKYIYCTPKRRKNPDTGFHRYELNEITPMGMHVVAGFDSSSEAIAYGHDYAHIHRDFFGRGGQLTVSDEEAHENIFGWCVQCPHGEDLRDSESARDNPSFFDELLGGSESYEPEHHGPPRLRLAPTFRR